MPSHLHMIVSAKENYKLSDIIRDFKKFTSKKIIKTIGEINESREWLLDKFSFAARINIKNKEYKFWQDGFHPIALYSNEFKDQKLDYIHNNPIESGIVSEAEHYKYSSAISYAGGLGLLVVVYLWLEIIWPITNLDKHRKLVGICNLILWTKDSQITLNQITNLKYS